MTIAHLAPALSLMDHWGSAQSRFRLRAGAWRLFFEPTAHGVTRYPKSAGQSAQRTAFLIGTQNFFALRFTVTIRLWFRTAAPPTVVTFVALLSIFRQAVLDDLFAATVVAFDNRYDHMGETITSHPLEPLPSLVVILTENAAEPAIESSWGG